MKVNLKPLSATDTRHGIYLHLFVLSRHTILYLPIREIIKAYFNVQPVNVTYKMTQHSEV